ncbi:MAG: hypothetical protein OWU84_09070 [Firmicutes bacterium]|nr:hypothetical protein [Bacillota bacterium]
MLSVKRYAILRSLVLLFVLIVGSGCGAPSAARPEPPTLTVYLAQKSLATLPVELAAALGLFADNHLRIRWVDTPNATVRIAMAGHSWPIVGYLAVRPDVVLVAPEPDPSFRLRHLDHLPLLLARAVKSDAPLIERALALHGAKPSSTVLIPWTQIAQGWQHQGLPWVWVSLPQAVQLRALNPHTRILAWLGASTGPIPVWTISAPADNVLVSRFLNSVNLALWYLHTNSAGTIAEWLPGKVTPNILRLALHYEYWPRTTYPAQTLYDRAQKAWVSGWPAYGAGVNPLPAYHALAMTARY